MNPEPSFEEQVKNLQNAGMDLCLIEEAILVKDTIQDRYPDVYAYQLDLGGIGVTGYDDLGNSIVVLMENLIDHESYIVVFSKDDQPVSLKELNTFQDLVNERQNGFPE